MADSPVDDRPRVSLLTPTRDRRRFLPWLVAAVRRQDWPADRLELVVVDDGRDRVDDVFDGLDLGGVHVVYEHLGTRVPLGTKRNRTAELATGEILVHLDDDDWYPADRVAKAVAHLRETGAEVVGTSPLAFWDAGTRAIHRIPKIGDKHACAGTMAYTKAYWEAHRFAPDPHTEERQFLQNFAAKLKQLPGEPWETVLCISHGENTLPKNTNMPVAPVALADVVTDAAQRAFYESLELDDW